MVKGIGKSQTTRRMIFGKPPKSTISWSLVLPKDKLCRFKKLIYGRWAVSSFNCTLGRLLTPKIRINLSTGLLCKIGRQTRTKNHILATWCSTHFSHNCSKLTWSNVFVAIKPCGTPFLTHWCTWIVTKYSLWRNLKCLWRIQRRWWCNRVWLWVWVEIRRKCWEEGVEAETRQREHFSLETTTMAQ